MNDINDWERRRSERLAQEVAELTDRAFERYEIALQKAKKHAVIKVDEDVLQHFIETDSAPTPRHGLSIRDFHIRWATRLQVMAGDQLVADLAEADMVGAGL